MFYDVLMTATDVSPDLPTAPSRSITLDALVRSLETRCASLWAVEPATEPSMRDGLLHELSAVDHELLVLALRLVDDPAPAERTLAVRIMECERRVSRLERRWRRAAA